MASRERYVSLLSSHLMASWSPICWMSNGFMGAASAQMLTVGISPGPFEVNEDVAWFSPFAWTDYASTLQFVHNPSRPSVAEAKPSLHKRNAGLLLTADDLHTLLDEVFIFITFIIG